MDVGFGAGLTRELAKFVCEFDYGNVPEGVLTQVKTILVDTFGCMLGGSIEPVSRILLKYVKSMGGTGESTVLCFGDKANAYDAALVNGTAGHAWDFDAINFWGHHMYSALTAATLALGEKELITGKEFLTAFVAGAEVQCHIGKAGKGEEKAQWGRGWSGMGTLGPFGTAAACSKILNLDAEKTVNALSIAMLGSAGTYVHTRSVGGETNRLKAGLAASTGVRAALLAKEGFTGTKVDLEDPEFGFFKVYYDKYDLTKLTDGLGKEFLVTAAHFKPYASCGASHAPIYMIAKLRDENNISPEDVEEITLTVREKPWMVTVIPYPQDIVSQQWCVPYLIATTLYDKGPWLSYNFPTCYAKDRIKNPKIKALTEKVKFVEDPEIKKIKCTIKLKDGRQFTTEYDGGLRLTPEDIRKKFTAQASAVGFPNEKIKEAIHKIENLEKLNYINELTPLLVEN